MLFMTPRCRATSMSLLDGTAPAALRIFFLSYPIVTNVAFEGEFFFMISDPAQRHLLTCGHPVCGSVLLL